MFWRLTKWKGSTGLAGEWENCKGPGVVFLAVGQGARRCKHWRFKSRFASCGGCKSVFGCVSASILGI